MAATGNRGGGRRSKGERSFVGVRVPVEYREKLDHVAKDRNLSVSEFVDGLIRHALDGMENDSRSGHEAQSLQRTA